MKIVTRQKGMSRQSGFYNRLHLRAFLVASGCVILFCSVQGFAADWKFYSQTAEALYYFDLRSVISFNEKILGVQVKLNFTDTGILEMIEQFGKDYQDMSYEVNDYELDCVDRKFRISSVTRYSKNGKILFRVSRDGAEWNPIPPDSTGESLYKMVCK